MAIFVSIVVVVFAKVNESDEISINLLSNYAPSTLATTQILNGVNESQVYLLSYLLHKQASFKKARKIVWQEHIEAPLAELKKLVLNYTGNSSKRKIFRAIKSDLKKLNQTQVEIENIAVRSDLKSFDKAIVEFKVKLTPLMFSLEGHIHDMLGLTKESMALESLKGENLEKILSLLS